MKSTANDSQRRTGRVTPPRAGRWLAGAILLSIGLLAVGAPEAGASPGGHSAGRAATASIHFSQISAGFEFACGLENSGAAICWGDDQYGQAEAPSGKFTHVSAGATFACGLRSGGTIVCWGDDSLGQRKAPSGRFTGVSASLDVACALKSDGRLVCWGHLPAGDSHPWPGGRFKQVSAGGQVMGRFLFDSPRDEYACALRLNGHVVCFATYDLGEGGDSIYGNDLVLSQVSVGGGTDAGGAADYACGLTPKGRVVCWGDNTYMVTHKPAGTFVEVTAGLDYACAVKASGLTVCWTSGPSLITAPQRMRSTTRVSAGRWYACGLKSGGIAVCWGADFSGQLQAPPWHFMHISVGADASGPEYDFACAVTPAHKVVCRGANGGGEISNVPSGAYSQVAAGYAYACALTQNGVAHCWGGGTGGYPGKGADSPKVRFRQVSVWSDSGCGVWIGQSLRCWGGATPPSGHFRQVVMEPNTPGAP